MTLSIGFGVARAENLPIRSYTSADGLLRDDVGRVVADSSGFLWFLTSAGLCRFDGDRFVTFGKRDGLPGNAVHALLETRSGERWIAADEGLARIATAKGKAKPFETVPVGARIVTGRIHSLVEDESGRLFAGADRGLFEVDRSHPGSPVLRDSGIEIALDRDLLRIVWCLLIDHEKRLWMGTSTGIYRLGPKGEVKRFGMAEGLPEPNVKTLVETSDHRFFAGTILGLVELSAEPDESGRIVGSIKGLQDGLPGNEIRDILETSDRNLWVSTVGGLARLRFAIGALQPEIQTWTERNGLSDRELEGLTEDRDGNLWIGSESGGAMKLARSGWSRFDSRDGLVELRIGSIFESLAGELCVMAGEKRTIHRFDGGKFVPSQPAFPRSVRELGWGWSQVAFQDHTGEWWIPTFGGLARFAAARRPDELEKVLPKKIYTTTDGLGGNEIFRLFEDSRGDIWIGIISSGGRSHLAKWRRSDDRIVSFYSEDGLPGAAPTAFGEDCSGNIWIGFYTGGLVRFANEKFERFGIGEGVAPDGNSALPSGSTAEYDFVHALDRDADGSLWSATAAGLVRIDDPGSAHPRFRIYDSRNGLASGAATAVTHDLAGDVYIGSRQGVDRLVPSTGSVRHYSVADGLANNSVSTAFRDRSGSLWFGTFQGLSRLTPVPNRQRRPPPVRLVRVSIGAVSVSLPPVGTLDLDLGILEPGRNRIEIEAVGLGFSPGEKLRFQFRIDGVDADWNPPSDQRVISLARLAPGPWQVFVRAVDADGVVSNPSARVAFTFLPPVWRRPWFLLMAALALMSIAIVLYRWRVARYESRQKELSGLVVERTAELASAKSEVEEINRGLEQRVREGIDALRESEREAAYGRMVAGLAHEIRHPVFAIRAITYVLASEVTGDETLSEHVKTIDHETRRMTALVDELLDFARPAALRLADVGIEDLFDEAVQLFRAEVDPEKKISVVTEVEAGTGAAPIDRARMLQVLVNLMQNAAKHARGIRRIALTARLGGAGYELDVTNDGAPIREEAREKMFDPFFTTGKGTGLGLAIVKRIVHDHGGTIEAESGDGGTRFRIRLPIDAARSEPPAVA